MTQIPAKEIDEILNNSTISLAGIWVKSDFFSPNGNSTVIMICFSPKGGGAHFFIQMVIALS